MRFFSPNNTLIISIDCVGCVTGDYSYPPSLASQYATDSTDSLFSRDQIQLEFGLETHWLKMLCFHQIVVKRTLNLHKKTWKQKQKQKKTKYCQENFFALG